MAGVAFWGARTAAGVKAKTPFGNCHEVVNCCCCSCFCSAESILDASTTLRTNETASSPLTPGNAAVPPLTAPVCNANGAEGRVPMIVHPGNGDSGVVKAEVAEVEGGGRSGG